MKKLTCLLLIVCLYASCNSENAPDCLQTTGSIVQQTKEVPQFSKIRVNEGIHLVVKQGTTYEVQIQSGKNLINDIEAKVVDDRLILSNNNTCNLFRSYENTTAFVTVPNLIEIRSSTQFDVRSDGVLNFADFTIISEDFADTTAQSVGNFYLNLNCDEFRLVFNNLSNAFMEGTVGEASIEFESGNGRFEGENLLIENATIFHRGTNDIIINVTNSLQGDIVSTGNIIVVSTPNQVAVSELYRGRLIFRD